MFEARYENELFLADGLLSRGGATSPEDHVWLDRLMAAYEASADAAYDFRQDIPDPWALDTQPEIFGTTPEVRAPDTNTDPLPDSFSLGDEEDPVAQGEKAARGGRESSQRPASGAGSACP